MAEKTKKVVKRIKAQADTNADSSVPTVKRIKATEAKQSTTNKSPKATAKTAGPVASTNKVATKVKSTKATKTTKATGDGTRAPKRAAPWLRTLLKPVDASVSFLKGSFYELSQVTWPGRRTTWKLTFGVMVFCAIVGVIVLIGDWVFQWLIKEVIL